MRKEYSVALHNYRGVALGAFMDGTCLVIVLPFLMIEISRKKPW